jgi:hypothetical protein
MPESPRIAELRRRLEKDPASIAFAQLAEEYRRSGDHEQAVRICRDGLARHPGYLSAQVTLGRALMELGFYEEARRELESVLKVAPDNLAAIRALAVIHQRRRHASTAEAKQQPDLPAEEPPAAPAIEVPPPAHASVPEIAVPAIVDDVDIPILADAPSMSQDAGEPILADPPPPISPDPGELIVPDAEELIVPEAAAPVVHAPPLPDFTDWTLDVDLAMDAPGDTLASPLPPPFETGDPELELTIEMPGDTLAPPLPPPFETGDPELELAVEVPGDVLAATPPHLLRARDPALEHLEQWLAAIVSDRHQSG